jgi:thiol:disulfide interchange protein DsbD
MAMKIPVIVLFALGGAGCQKSAAGGGGPDRVTVTIQAPAPGSAAPAPDRASPLPERAAIAWEPSEPRAASRARAEKRPLLVYFTAAWCAACAELERGPFKDPRVTAAASRFVAVRIDATDDEAPALQAVKASYAVAGLPTLVLVDSSGREARRINEFVRAELLAEALRGVP